MRAALVVDGKVENIVRADQAWVDANGGIALPDNSPVGPGWLHLGGDSFEAPPEVISIPDVLTPRQIRLVLNAAGLRATVEAAVSMSDQNTQDMWAFSQEFRRNDPVLVAMAAQIGLSAAQLDQLFIQGAAL